ncbi:MAG: D-TA family PLP-dependent enzyme [Acidobacteriaceae bacterium]
MNICDLDTPSVLISMDVMERNLARLSEYCTQYNLKLRPHTKTHKIPELAHKQLSYGAIGVTVAKLGEAEVMADAGVEDILIAYPLVGREKLRRFVALASRSRVTVAVDSLEVAEAISGSVAPSGCRIGVLTEFNTGLRRCGLPVSASSVSLVERMSSLPGLEWRGLLVYPGHIMSNSSDLDLLIGRENSLLERLLELVNRAGLDCHVVSGGNTPTAYSSHRFAGVTEIRPGTYIFNDKNTVCAGAASWSDCAATILTTVVSRSVAGRAILDAGSKTLSSDRLATGDQQGFGRILEYPQAIIEGLSEEHGHVDTSTMPEKMSIGERVRVIPNHVCVVMNLHDVVYGVEGERVVAKWRVAARGKVT